MHRTFNKVKAMLKTTHHGADEMPHKMHEMFPHLHKTHRNQLEIISNTLMNEMQHDLEQFFVLVEEERSVHADVDMPHEMLVIMLTIEDMWKTRKNTHDSTLQKRIEKEMETMQEELEKKGNAMSNKAWHRTCDGFMKAKKEKEFHTWLKRTFGNKHSHPLSNEGTPMRDEVSRLTHFDELFSPSPTFAPEKIYHSEEHVKRAKEHHGKATHILNHMRMHPTSREWKDIGEMKKWNKPLQRWEHDEMMKLAVTNTPGLDGISMSFVKSYPDVFLDVIFDLFKLCFKFASFPTKFKHAVMVAIPKKKPNKFRPVSSLSVVGKAFERMSQRRLEQFVVESNLLSKHQAGATTKSAEEQVFAAVQKIQESLMKGRLHHAVFLDMVNAFNSVTSAHAARRMLKAGLRGDLLLIVVEHFCDGLANVKEGKLLSALKEFAAATPQGSVIASIMFVVFINSLLKKLENVCPISYMDDV